MFAFTFKLGKKQAQHRGAMENVKRMLKMCRKYNLFSARRCACFCSFSKYIRNNYGPQQDMYVSVSVGLKSQCSVRRRNLTFGNQTLV